MATLAKCVAMVIQLTVYPPTGPYWSGSVATLGMDGKWTVPSRVYLEEMRKVYGKLNDPDTCMIDKLLHPDQSVKFSPIVDDNCTGPNGIKSVVFSDPVYLTCHPSLECKPGQFCS